MGALKYPLILSTNVDQEDTNNYFMRFQARYILDETLVQKMKNYGLSVDTSTDMEKISPVVILPIPENIQEQLSHNWNLTKGLGSQLIESSIDSLLGIGGANLSNVVASAKSTSQISIDPNFKYVYQNSNPRTFTYSISMIPQSKDEADIALAICKYFKVYSSPIKIQGSSFTAKGGSGAIGKTLEGIKSIADSIGVDLKAGAISNFLWSISFNNTTLNNITKFYKHKFVLSSVDINYTANGAALFYLDGNPKQINLTLTFNEVQVMYHSDWSD